MLNTLEMPKKRLLLSMIKELGPNLKIYTKRSIGDKWFKRYGKETSHEFIIQQAISIDQFKRLVGVQL